MRASGGVIAAAVIALLGSAASLLMGILMAITSLAMPPNGDFPSVPAGIPEPPFSMAAIIVVESVGFAVLGIFGIICSVFLLRLKNWARISFLIFAGFLCFIAVSTAFGVIVVLMLPGLIPQPEGVPQGALFAGLVFAALFDLLLVGISIWWLVYFSRRKVKEHFLGAEKAAVPRRGPLSLTIIAWLLVIGGAFMPFALAFSYPAVLFGIVFHGWPARVILLCSGLTGLIAGVGMLRWRPWAHSLALALYLFALINQTFYVLMPSAFARMFDLMKEVSPQNAIFQSPVGGTFVWLSMWLGLFACSVPLWFLIRRRRAFLDACGTSPLTTA